MRSPIVILSGTLAAIAIFATSPAFAEPAYATRNVNVRSGPGLTYEVVDQLIADEPVEKGICNSDKTWCYVRHEGDNGWVAAVFLTSTPPGQVEQPPVVEAPVASDSAYRAKSQVNVRTGPGTNFSKIDRLDAGEEVTRGQCNDAGDWCYVNHDGADGWVAASFLIPVNPQTPPVSQPENAIRVATSPVNVRTGPGTNFSKIDRLDSGERVEVSQCSNDRRWCYVTHDGPDGWVAADYLRVPGPSYPVEPNPGTPNPPNPGGFQPQPTTQQVGTAITGMPVRSAPTLFTNSIGRIERGETIPVEECSADGYWCHVVNNTVDGWVPAAFLQIKTIEVQAPAVEAVEAVAARATPLRRIPGNGGAILGMLQAGSTITVQRCGPAGNWCQVTRNDLTGWVEANALKAPDNTPAQPPSNQEQPNSMCFTGFGGIEICLSQ